ERLTRGFRWLRDGPGAFGWGTDLATRRSGVRLHNRACPGHDSAAPTANDDSRDVTEREGLIMFAYAEMPQTWRRQAHGALVVVKKNVLRLPRMSHLQDPDASVGLAGGGTGCCQT
ncbi:MAG: hypothetical protein KAV00_05235, partial [Phycisphaerae bacterium]|nr:hypothetical protein [Phycisphaerae bacterium]